MGVSLLKLSGLSDVGRKAPNCKIESNMSVVNRALRRFQAAWLGPCDGQRAGVEIPHKLKGWMNCSSTRKRLINQTYRSRLNLRGEGRAVGQAHMRLISQVRRDHRFVLWYLVHSARRWSIVEQSQSDGPSNQNEKTIGS